MAIQSIYNQLTEGEGRMKWNRTLGSALVAFMVAALVGWFHSPVAYASSQACSFAANFPSCDSSISVQTSSIEDMPECPTDGVKFRILIAVCQYAGSPLTVFGHFHGGGVVPVTVTFVACSMTSGLCTFIGTTDCFASTDPIPESWSFTGPPGVAAMCVEALCCDE
jgi:hypothetical protein